MAAPLASVIAIIYNVCTTIVIKRALGIKSQLSDSKLADRISPFAKDDRRASTSGLADEKFPMEFSKEH